MTGVVEERYRAASTLGNPYVRAGVLLPPVGTLVYGIASSTIVDVEMFVTILAISFVLAIVAVTRPWQSTHDHQAERAWQALCGTVGVALVAPFLVLALDVPVERFTLLFALVIVVGAFSYPRRLRLPLCAWTLVVWAATLWWGGVRELWSLSLHLGGGLLLLAVCVGMANVLIDAVQVEAHSRAASEQRAQLLASILRTNSLEPRSVLRAVVTGLVDAGFDAVAIREVDAAQGRLRLVDGHELPGVELAEVLPLSEAHLTRQALARREPVVVDDYDRSAATLFRGRGFRGTVTVPVEAPGGPTTVVIAASERGPLTPEQLEAATLLAEQAARALDRARAFEADRETVEKLRLLDQRTQDFISTVSHELRTPLTVVQGLGQTLLRRWDHLEDDQRADLLARMGANADRLAVMVRSLLDVSAFERGELALSREHVDMRPLTAAVVHRLETLSSVHRVEVAVPEGLTVDADPSLLDHVLENLLLNVVKHTPPGTEARVSAHREDGLVEVAVADDGPGIPPADLPHVLDRFYRGGMLTSRPAGGLGLGLALARDIVRLHGSKLEVDSSEGDGTTFRFRLAVASGP